MMKKSRGIGGGGGGGAKELKQRAITALNKLADRDTWQLGVEELERTAERLPTDAVSPFLSCILETLNLSPNNPKDQKTRKECIRLIAVLASFHPLNLLHPLHLSKIVAAIVKRLKDPDSLVRDACVSTTAVLASKLCGGDQQQQLFLVLAKPLLEALAEQNKNSQWGSALCLASLIRHSPNPPLPILRRIFPRTLSLLNSQHFMPKPALIHLITSILLAGGAPSPNLLSASISSLQQALSHTDWTTRKAASMALGEIASTRAPCFISFMPSCIQSLESCRFDKVKPVRDTALHALQAWKTLPGVYSPEPSEAGSCIKENFCGDAYSDMTSNSGSVLKEPITSKCVSDPAKRRIPLSARKTRQNLVDSHHSKADDWHIEIAVPKAHSISLGDLCNEESEGSSVTKTLEGMSTDITCTQDRRCEYVPMDNKLDYSSVSKLVADNFETKSMTVSHNSLVEGGLLKPWGLNQQLAVEGIASKEQIYTTKTHDRSSLDSTVTVNSSQTLHGCCSQVAREMASVQKQLSGIENKHSNLIELLQVFSTGVMDNLSMLQSKVSGLEQEVDRVVHALMQGGRHSHSLVSKLMKVSQGVSSPRLSEYTPRSFVDSSNSEASLYSAKNSNIWEEKTVSRSRSINSTEPAKDRRINFAMTTCSNAIAKIMQQSSRPGVQSMGQARKIDVSASESVTNARQNGPGSKNSLQCVKGFPCDRDLDSAYVEALCSSDELVLIELLDRTGPVLESLSHRTASDVLCTLASYFLEQRFTKSIIPWLQQVVDLSIIHGPNYLVLTAKARQEFFSAVQEAMNLGFSDPSERKSFSRLAMKLRQLWGRSSDASSYRSPNRDSCK